MKRRWWSLIIIALILMLFLSVTSGCASNKPVIEKKCPTYEITKTLIA